MSLFWHEISPYWQAILTLVVSVAVAFISWLQWQTATKQSETAKKQWETAERQAATARNRLRLDLFKRRIKVYDALIAIAAAAYINGHITPEEQNTCGNAIQGAEFLFNKEIDDYCSLLLQKASVLARKRI
jgi:hypothetical protein